MRAHINTGGFGNRKRANGTRFADLTGFRCTDPRAPENGDLERDFFIPLDVISFAQECDARCGDTIDAHRVVAFGQKQQSRRLRGPQGLDDRTHGSCTLIEHHRGWAVICVHAELGRLFGQYSGEGLLRHTRGWGANAIREQMKLSRAVGQFGLLDAHDRAMLSWIRADSIRSALRAHGFHIPRRRVTANSNHRAALLIGSHAGTRVHPHGVWIPSVPDQPFLVVTCPRAREHPGVGTGGTNAKGKDPALRQVLTPLSTLRRTEARPPGGAPGFKLDTGAHLPIDSL